MSIACKSASESTTARLTPRRTVWQVLDGWRLLASNDEAMPPLHHVEHRTNDRRILAEGVDARRQRKDGMDGRQPTILASHVVRGRSDRPERRSPDDELRGAEAQLIRQVRVPSGELRDVHALAIVELRQVDPGRWSRSHASRRIQSSSSPARTGLVSGAVTSCGAWIVANDPLGNDGRLVAAFALDGDAPGRLDAVPHVVNRRERDSRADSRTGRHRRHEPHAVESVVEGHARAVDRDRVAHQRAEQRQRQESVRDRRAERRVGLRALRIDMDPLMVAGRVGKGVDAILRDHEPVADATSRPTSPPRCARSTTVMEYRRR